jgi:hypothetical protein
VRILIFEVLGSSAFVSLDDCPQHQNAYAAEGISRIVRRDYCRDHASWIWSGLVHFLRRYADAWLAHPIWRADVECPMPSLPKMRVSDTKRRQDIHDWQELSALRRTVLIVAHLSSNPYEGCQVWQVRV